MPPFAAAQEDDVDFYALAVAAAVAQVAAMDEKVAAVALACMKPSLRQRAASPFHIARYAKGVVERTNLLIERATQHEERTQAIAPGEIRGIKKPRRGAALLLRENAKSPRGADPREGKINQVRAALQRAQTLDKSPG